MRRRPRALSRRARRPTRGESAQGAAAPRPAFVSRTKRARICRLASSVSELADGATKLLREDAQANGPRTPCLRAGHGVRPGAQLQDDVLSSTGARRGFSSSTFLGMGRKLVVFEPDVCGCCRKVFGPFDSREAAAAFVDERRALRSLERGQPVRGWEMYFITSADESSALRPASGRRSRP